MNFQTAVRTCLAKYVDFTGRARRSEFWYFVLFSVLVSVVTVLLDRALGTEWKRWGLLNIASWLALLPPTLSVAARRLHDTGRSAWSLLLPFVPVLGAIALLVFFVLDSKADNEHGPDPKTDAG